MKMKSILKLSSAKPAILRMLKLVMYILGFNWHNRCADVMGFMYQVRYTHKMEVPTCPLVLFQMRGIGRKVLCLILQDAFSMDPGTLEQLRKHKFCAGITGDSHVANVAISRGWVPIGCTDPDKIAQLLEAVVDKRYWKGLNKNTAGIRQLRRKSDNRDTMLHIVQPLRL